MSAKGREVKAPKPINGIESIGNPKVYFIIRIEKKFVKKAHSGFLLSNLGTKQLILVSKKHKVWKNKFEKSKLNFHSHQTFIISHSLNIV